MRREVLAEIAQGKNNAAVGAALGLSERAVEKHISSLFAKLGLSEEPQTHRRVKAVLLYLAETGDREPGGLTPPCARVGARWESRPADATILRCEPRRP